jgi:RTX calcium-binding nonapeptide repeat (4 copies)
MKTRPTLSAISIVVLATTMLIGWNATPAQAATCATQGNLIVGTAGDDVLMGTDGVDIIWGLGGNDTIYGRGGNDVIFGEQGDDCLFGGADNDTLFGLSGLDVIVDGGSELDLCVLPYAPVPAVSCEAQFKVY